MATVSGPIFVSVHSAYFQEERAVVATMRLKMTLDQMTILPKANRLPVMMSMMKLFVVTVTVIVIVSLSLTKESTSFGFIVL